MSKAKVDKPKPGIESDAAQAKATTIAEQMNIEEDVLKASKEREAVSQSRLDAIRLEILQQESSCVMHCEQLDEKCRDMQLEFHDKIKDAEALVAERTKVLEDLLAERESRIAEQSRTIAEKKALISEAAAEETEELAHFSEWLDRVSGRLTDILFRPRLVPMDLLDDILKESVAK